MDKGIIFQLDNDLEGIVPLKRIPKHERKLWKDKFKPDEVFNVTVQELDQESKKVILMAELNIPTDGKESVEEVKLKNEPTGDKLENPQAIIDNLAGSDSSDKES